jgi:hypothetical protein
MDFNQGTFDFDQPAGEQGYHNWRQRLDDERRKFESRWGIVLGRPVRLKLSFLDRPIEGVVSLAQGSPRRKPDSPRLRLGNLEFTSAEVESVVAVRS